MKYIIAWCCALLVTLPAYGLIGEDEGMGGYMDTNVHCPDKTPVVREVNEQDIVATLSPIIEQQQQEQERRGGSSDAVQ